MELARPLRILRVPFSTKCRPCLNYWLQNQGFSWVGAANDLMPLAWMILWQSKDSDPAFDGVSDRIVIQSDSNGKIDTRELEKYDLVSCIKPNIVYSDYDNHSILGFGFTPYGSHPKIHTSAPFEILNLDVIICPESSIRERIFTFGLRGRGFDLDFELQFVDSIVCLNKLGFINEKHPECTCAERAESNARDLQNMVRALFIQMNLEARLGSDITKYHVMTY